MSPVSVTDTFTVSSGLPGGPPDRVSVQAADAPSVTGVVPAAIVIVGTGMV